MTNVANDLRANLLGNEDLSDVLLESKLDGMRVPAVRALLAARSSVFKSLLFGGYAESTDKVVPMEMPGDIIKMVVQFIYTDEIDLENEGVDVIALAVGADYCGLSQLVQLCVNSTNAKIKESPAVACSVLSSVHGVPTLKPMEDFALLTIRNSPNLALLGEAYSPSPVCCLSKSSLKLVLCDEKTHAEEIVLFRALQRWLLQGQEGPKKSKRCRTDDDASELAALIRLPSISPVVLRDEVLPSGIFTKDQIFSAFQQQAIACEISHNVNFSAGRGPPPVWKYSSTPIFSADNFPEHGVQLLDKELLPGAKYGWKLKIEKYCDLTWVGVASSNTCFDNEWLGKQSGGWVYGSNGSVNHATGQDNGPYNNRAPPFKEGDTIAMVLDLTGKSGGILTANGTTLFTGMVSESGGFIPAVSLCHPGRVRILEFSIS